LAGGITVGTYPLISYGNGVIGGAGFSAFTLALPPGVTATLVDNTATSPPQIELQVTAVVPEIWTGAVNGNWDINTTANWRVGASPTVFANSALVQFDDTVGSGPTTVNLATTVLPGSVTVSNYTDRKSV